MNNNERENIDFVIGEEKSLHDVLSETEIGPLLEETVRCGADKAYLVQDDGTTLFGQGTDNELDAFALTFDFPLSLEGETIGKVVVNGPREKESLLKGLSGLLAKAVQTILNNNLKRLLTTEIHTTVVSQSYDELLQTHNNLVQSEGKYRELAKNLEIRVEERTAQLKKTHAKLLQQEKLAAVGQLAAGMAHEINNPLGFISSNLNTLTKYAGNMTAMIGVYQNSLANGNINDQEKEIIRQKWQKLKLDFILPDVDELIKQSIEGCGRIGKIVADLKGFSHIDEGEESVVDINQEIDRTLSVLAHQIPADAEIIKNYEDLPGFSCNAAQLCHVFLNIILNAIQVKSVGLQLAITTKNSNSQVIVQFADNGPGMKPELVNRIFEPFFTTKEVGDGKGIGLSVVHDIVTNFGGIIDVNSVPDQGTTFIISLPFHKAVKDNGRQQI